MSTSGLIQLYESARNDFISGKIEERVFLDSLAQIQSMARAERNSDFDAFLSAKILHTQGVKLQALQNYRQLAIVLESKGDVENFDLLSMLHLNICLLLYQHKASMEIEEHICHVSQFWEERLRSIDDDEILVRLSLAIRYADSCICSTHQQQLTDELSSASPPLLSFSSLCRSMCRAILNSSAAESELVARISKLKKIYSSGIVRYLDTASADGVRSLARVLANRWSCPIGSVRQREMAEQFLEVTVICLRHQFDSSLLLNIQRFQWSIASWRNIEELWGRALAYRNYLSLLYGNELEAHTISSEVWFMRPSELRQLDRYELALSLLLNDAALDYRGRSYDQAYRKYSCALALTSEAEKLGLPLSSAVVRLYYADALLCLGGREEVIAILQDLEKSVQSTLSSN